MKIDGYTPADPEIAGKIGVTFEYKTQYGDFKFRALSSGKENKKFKVASEKLKNKREIRVKTGFKPDTLDEVRETLEVWYDTIILDWSTTVKSDGQPIKPTRENFIEMLSTEALIGVFLQLTEDCGDFNNFVKKAEEESIKN